MGITSEDLFNGIYNVMFSPKDFFENENMNISVRLAAGLTAVCSAAASCAYSIAYKSAAGLNLIFSIFSSVIAALFAWFIIGLFFEYAAKIFNKSGQLSKILYLTSYAFVPAILYAPLYLLKNLGAFGYFVSVILSCILFFWMMYLYAYALKSTYSLSFARAFMLIFLPFISLIPAVYQIAGFYNDMRYIFSI